MGKSAGKSAGASPENASVRKIIHCDCDCFYAAVEMRDDPGLKDLPVAVGGDSKRRGVIATCNYVARAYGVHSAMPSGYARKLCPELVIIPPDFQKYRQVSAQIHEIFHRYTDQVEPLSLDEAFLDVSDSDQCHGSATLIARAIRQAVREEVDITISAGVAPNKFLAKIASDWNKPDGLFVITPDEISEFVAALPVKKIFGVGPATAAKLERLGVHTCADLQQWSLLELSRKFGVFGERLYHLSRGVDSRPVKTSRRRKSLSVERTFAEDLVSWEELALVLPNLFSQMQQRLLRLDGDYEVVKAFVKMRFEDFSTTTTECVATEIQESLFRGLCKQAWARKGLPVRLLGVGVRFRDMEMSRDFYQYELNLQHKD